MNKKQKINLTLSAAGLFLGACFIKCYQNKLNNQLTFEEKKVLFWEKKVYDKVIHFFIKVRAHNWDELIKNRDRFFVYFGKKSNPECLNFAPRLSYVARKKGVNIYYIDTTKKATNPILKKLMEELGINKTPMLLHIDQGKVARYNFDEKLEDFITAHY